MRQYKNKLLVGLLVAGLFSCKEPSASGKLTTVDTTGHTKSRPDSIIAPPKPPLSRWLFDTLTIDGNYFTRQLKLRTPVTVSERRKNPLFAFFPPLERTQADLQFYFFDTLIKHPEHPAVLIGTATENEQTIWLVQQQTGKQTPYASLMYYEDFVEYLTQTAAQVRPHNIVVKHLEYDEQDRTQTKTTVVLIDSSTGLLKNR